MARIPLVSADSLTPDQRTVYEQATAGPRKVIIGPLRAALHSPELAERWQQLGAVLRYGTSLSPRVKELAILATARRWNTPVEWHVHEAAARSAGLTDAAIEAIRHARPPTLDDADEAVAYEFTRELQETGRVSSSVYDAAHLRFGTVGIVELTALVGYYTMVAMTLNAHEIGLPDHADEGALPSAGPTLTPLGPHPIRPDASNGELEA